KAIVYRSHLDVRAMALDAFMATEDKPGAAGDILWKIPPFDHAFARLLEPPLRLGHVKPATENWLNGLLTAKQPWPVLENSFQGALSTDGTRIFAVDDIGVPVTAGDLEPPPWKKRVAAELKSIALNNDLWAMDAESGRLRWRLPDRAPLTLSGHFLGPPLLANGKLH